MTTGLPRMKARLIIEYGDRLHETFVDEPSDEMFFLGMSDAEIVHALAGALTIKMVEQIKSDQTNRTAKGWD